MSEPNYKKPIPQILKIIGVLLLLIAGYFYFLSSIRSNNDRLFDTKETLSWAQAGETVYRVAARGEIEEILLSHDYWKEYRFSLSVFNPHNCGVIFDYVNPLNHGFFYFQKDLSRLIIGQIVNGNTNVLHSIPYDFSQTPIIVLKKYRNQVEIIVNNQSLAKIPSSSLSSSKVGLLLSAATKPPVIFHDISIEGKLENGWPCREKIDAPEKGNLLGTWINLIPFYLAFMLLVFYLIRIFRRSAAEAFLSFIEKVKVKEDFKNIYAVLIHVFLAVCFFWPFITKGQIAVFSYDNLGEIYPLFFYAKHNFINILQGHAPWLWNPIILNGFSYYSNHWDMIYYPFNWPIFLFPDKDFLTALTCKSFLEVAFTGIFAYGFFNLEFRNKRWALYSAVVYQLCSLMIFTMGVFPATSLYFAMTVYLYILWSMPNRRGIHNFLLLTFSVVLILTSANVAFIFYACLSLGVVSVYRFLSLSKFGRKTFGIVSLAWLLGFLISSVRILSCLQGVLGSNRMVENFQTIHDRAYMVLRLFVPEITGWFGPHSFQVLMSPNLRLIFAEMDLPSNPQNNFFIYFGALPALLLIVSYLFRSDSRHTFWKVYAAVTIGIALLWQPLWGILSILCFPLNHYSYHTIILPVGVCALIGYTGMAIENEKFEWAAIRKPFLIILGFVFAYICVFITYVFPSFASVTRIIFLIASCGIASYFLMRNRFVGTATSLFSYILLALNVLIFVLLVLLTVFLVLKPLPKKELVVQGLILPFLWIVAGGGTLLHVYIQDKIGRSVKAGGIFLTFIFAMLGSGIIIYSPFGNSMHELADAYRIYTLDLIIGNLRFYLLLQIALIIFIGLSKKIFTKKFFFMVFLLLTMGDLIVFNARFNDITAPFYFKQAFYPKDFAYKDISTDFRKNTDLVNYRVSHQDKQDFGANKNLIFNLPSYTGTVGYMSKRYSRLLTNFGYPQGIFMLYPEDATSDPRFLDLSAVRYVLGDKDRVTERPTALGRLNFIYSAEVIEDEDQLLARLKDESFDPHKTVLLSAPSVIPISRSNRSALFIPLTQKSPNEVSGRFIVDSPGYVLFAESYHTSWKAYVDGSPAPVLLANFNFMACAITTPGMHEIRFVYDPPAYKRNLFLSAFGLLVFGIIVVMAFLRPRKQ